MALKQVFANGGVARMRQVTDNAPPKDEKTEPSKDPTAEDVVSQKSKDGSVSDVRKSGVGSLKSGGDAKGRITPNLSTPDGEPMPEFDPEDPTKYKVTPDIAVINMTNLGSISQLITMFLVPKSLEEDMQYRLTIQDTEQDRFDSVNIVDLAEGLGAEYIHLKGCSKIGKIAKIMRFCEMKSALLNE